ncbi:hypothetical protein FFA01_11970 [Frigoribacterium faeni]|uniref:Uncharacterized protein n=2 Tax=Frigoribacterium faeni TaxID=145483 RepID=A0ABQ0UN19_9MICO|nr:hypothetical protein FFA01_11970 [Frigoribacterium faeni]
MAPDQEARCGGSTARVVGMAARETSRRNPATRVLAALSGASLVLGLGSLAVVSPAAAADYPTWAEVEAAKGDTAATQRQVDRVVASLDGLEKTAAARSDDAVAAAQADAEAEAALAAASQAADQLADRAARAAASADEAHQQAGRLAGRLFLTGGTQSMSSELFASDDPDAVLYRLGALTQLGDRWQNVLSDATASSNTVASLSAQASAAATERDSLAREARTAADTATAAQARADAEVTSATEQSTELYAQLATLKDTSAEVEQRYRTGVAARAAYEAQQKAARRAAAEAEAARTPSAPAGGAETSSGGSGSAGSGSGSAGGGSTAPPSGAVDDPAGAKAFAATLVGTGSEYTCLVQLWNKESGWRTTASNPGSGAYGIPQSLPGNKMASVAFDWQTNYRTQVTWGVGYIRQSYGTMCGAWAHSVANDWY